MFPSGRTDPDILDKVKSYQKITLVGTMEVAFLDEFDKHTGRHHSQHKAFESVENVIPNLMPSSTLFSQTLPSR